MGCSDCYNGSLNGTNQIPLDENSILFSEIPNGSIKKYAYYVDGETYF